MQGWLFVGALVAAAGTVNAQWSDNFNRPDGPIGGDWTQTSGTWVIQSNQGKHTSALPHEILTHNAASLAYASSVTKLDVFRTTGTTGNTLSGVLIGLGGADSIMVKVQAQTGTGDFSHIGIYHRQSPTLWGPWGGGGIIDLTAPFSSCRMTVSFPTPDVIRVDLDTDLNGTTDQTYTSSGVSQIAPNFGTGYGITGWMTDSTFDNWSVTPSCYANCDNSTLAPCLNVNDYVCFNNLFAAGNSAANCDGSTLAPILNVNDYVCFNNRFAAGCGANNCSARP